MALLAVCAVGAQGCRMMIKPFTSEIIRTRPHEGYMSNYDPTQHSITARHADGKTTNPVMTQHILVASVKDETGRPLGGKRVEWIVADTPHGTGNLVAVDPTGWWAHTRGYRVNPRYGISHTNHYATVLDRGTEDASDDIVLERGETWCQITSPVQGDTHMIVYAPGIRDETKHKAFIVKHWLDAEWVWPGDAQNRMGAPHAFATIVRRASDKAPLPGMRVLWQIEDDDPDAEFMSTRSNVADTVTDKSGRSEVVLRQMKPSAGENTVSISIFRDDGVLLDRATAKKTWMAPTIALSKTGPAAVSVGDKVTWTMTLSNPSAVDTGELVVTDTVPEGVTVVSTAPPAQEAAGRLKWQLRNLLPQASKTFTIVARTQRTGKVVNVVDAVTAEGISAQAQADLVVTQPGLELSKTGPRVARKGDDIPFQVRVSNPGSGAATNVVVVDQIPEGLSHSTGERTFRWNVGEIEAGGSREETLALRAERTGNFVNKVAATADGGLEAEAQAPVRVVAPSAQIAKIGPAERYANERATYKITISNDGDAVAQNVIVQDPVPEGSEFVSASNGGVYDEATRTVRWDVGDVAPGAAKELRLTLRLVGIGRIKNVATLTADGVQLQAEAVTVVRGRVALHCSCHDTEDPVTIGEETTYVVTLRNEGSATATQVVLVNTIPTQMKFVDAQGPVKFTVKDRIVTFEPVSVLKPGEEVVFRITTKALQVGTTGEAVNDATFNCKEFTSKVSSQEGTKIYKSPTE